MKTKLPFTCLLLFWSSLVYSQITGVFTVSQDAQSVEWKKLSGTAQAYEVLEFQFPIDWKGTLVSFVDSSKVKTVTSGKIGTDMGTPMPDYYRVRLLKNDRLSGYTIEGQSTVFPLDFRMRVGTAYSGVFHFTDDRQVEYEPGYLLYDALYIDANRTNADKQQVIAQILKWYGVSSSTINQNAFLKELPTTIKLNIQGAGSDLPNLTPANVGNAVGALDVTNLADGFAKFIVERTKQELDVAFFDRFKEILHDSSAADLRVLFPQTTRVLNVIGEEIYMYQAYLQTLREAFENDLAHLPAGFPDVVNNHRAFFDKNPELKSVVDCGLYVLEQMYNQEHIGSLISNFPVDDVFGTVKSDSNVKGAFQTLQLLSQSLQGKDDSERYWAPDADLKRLFSTNDSAFKIYLGLLEERADKLGITFTLSGQELRLKKLIDTSYVNYSAFKTYLRALTTKIQGIERQIESLRASESDSLKYEKYYTIATASLAFMEQMTDVEQFPFFSKNQHLKNNAPFYFYVAELTAEMAIDVNRRNYASAIVNLVQLYDTVFTGQSNTSFVTGELLKYGTFMSALVTATNSDEVATAIEAFALPSGSARIKRESVFNVSLNAYCGLYGGYERIRGIDPAWGSASSLVNSFGVTAPIGIAISKGKGSFIPVFGVFSNKGHWSHSLFLSVVDIGALTAFRFTDDSTSSVPNIQLRDIVSPGVFYSLGIPKSPVSVNFGWQMGPLLREVTAVQNEYSSSYSRVSLSLCVDLPVVNFYTVTDARKKKR